ncbi:DUF6890 family protein [Pseudoalteromonas ruthenica]
MPGSAPGEENLARALFLEIDYWKKMAVAVNNGIASALSE